LIKSKGGSIEINREREKRELEREQKRKEIENV
jgi:hypothetical protein